MSSYIGITTLAVIGTGARWMEADGRLAGDLPMFYTAEDIALYLPWNMPLANPTLMGRAEVFHDFPHRDGLVLASDYDWLARVGEHHRLGCVSLPLLHYRRHAGSASVARPLEGQAFGCAVRLLTARRRAGRSEDFADLTVETGRMVAAKLPRGRIYRHFAGRCRREGFPLLAAFHAALAVREQATPGNAAAYLRCLCAAVRADPAARRAILGGAAKTPFWILLRRAGFPAFPRY